MHYNNLVVKVWLKVRLEFIRIQLYLCCIHEKKSGKIFFIREKLGNYQGISFLDFCGHPDQWQDCTYNSDVTIPFAVCFRRLYRSMKERYQYPLQIEIPETLPPLPDIVRSSTGKLQISRHCSFMQKLI